MDGLRKLAEDLEVIENLQLESDVVRALLSEYNSALKKEYGCQHYVRVIRAILFRHYSSHAYTITVMPKRTVDTSK